MATKRRRQAHGWHGDRWHPVVTRAIRRRLQARRERLADLLDIDLDEQECQAVPPNYPSGEVQMQVQRYIKWRRTPSFEGRRVHKIDLALNELTGVLRRCWSLLRDVNRAASLMQLYRKLEEIERDPDRFAARLDELDPETRGWIEDFYPGGWIALEDGPVKAKLLAKVARTARATLPKPKRGRPKGIVDFAGQHLAKGLAEIYSRYREINPSRRVVPESGGVEYGPFRDFVEAVMSAVPHRLRQTTNEGYKGVNHLVRVGVEHIKSPVRRR